MILKLRMKDKKWQTIIKTLEINEDELLIKYKGNLLTLTELPTALNLDGFFIINVEIL